MCFYQNRDGIAVGGHKELGWRAVSFTSILGVDVASILMGECFVKGAL